MFNLIRQDFRAYTRDNGKFCWEEPSIIIVILFRIGSYIRSIRFAPLRWLLTIFHLPIYMFFELFIGINIPRGAKIDGGLRIYHYGTIVLNSKCIIGKNCIIHHGVTIGVKNAIEDVPIIGDNVNIGCGAVIIGRIKIGNNVDIGANAVVLRDVPDNCIAVGNPARILKKTVE